MNTFLLLGLVMKHGHRFKDIAGKRFGRWLVVCLDHIGNHSYWRCRCDCGNEKIVNGPRLRAGRSNSCGCLANEMLAQLSTKHGEGRHGKETVEFKTWLAMLNRCSNPRHKQFSDYGGRGIKVCRRWRKSYKHFLSDMERRPEGDYSIHRINNDKGYSPNNCKWATRKEQCANTRANSYLTANGKRQIMIEWERETGILEATIRARLKRGWTPELAVTEPVSSLPLVRRVT